ncbi:MAG: DUF6308 family protein [Cellulomonadaceae bacterium]|jgi:hypothetical protein|nr:DUF6308 family protein [Cellulomonadaceae bacterium]
MTARLGPGITLAGRPFPDAGDLVRRFCGMAWSGGAGGEYHELEYYDALVTDPLVLSEVDVLAAQVLNPNMGPRDRQFFVEHAADVAAWLAPIPLDATLADAPDEMLDHLERLVTAWPGGPTLSVLSKVLHRKRPGLIPLVDRNSIDLYRLVTGERVPARAWPGMLDALSDDVYDNRKALAALSAEVLAATGVTVSPLRVVDITIWMHGHR